jgi:glutaminase
MAISQAHKRYQADHSGTMPASAPGLPKVSPDLYGIVIVRVDGKTWTAGDARIPLLLADLAAPFTAALAAGQGATPSTLDVQGSLVTLSRLQPKHDPDAQWRAVLGNLGAFAGRELSIDDGAHRASNATASAVLDLARQLGASGTLEDDADGTAALYTKQGAVTLTTYDLAVMAATLANDGKHPLNGRSVVGPEVAKSLQSMIGAEGLSRAGMPAVAGSSGCIIAVVPRRFGLAVCSPPLDAAGHSVRGQRAIRYLSQALLVNLDAS